MFLASITVFTSVIVHISGLSEAGDRFLADRQYFRKTCSELGYDNFLDLSNHSLQQIDKSIGFYNTISCLDLRDNRLTFLDPYDLYNMASLKYLNLANNNISQSLLRLNVDYLDNLETVILDGNKIRLYTSGLHITGRLPKLKYLHLRNTSLHYVTCNNCKTPKLTHLYLADNPINMYELFSKLPKTVTHLYLESAGIYFFGNENLDDLQALSLDDNHIEHLCGFHCSAINEFKMSIIGAKQLEYLSIASNKIRHIEDDTFIQNEQLLNLNLSSNLIEHISNETFRPLIKLKKLSLNDNSLLDVPYICFLPKLKELFLSKNRIRALTNRTFCNFTRLERLDLSFNEISLIETKTFHGMHSLKELDLSNNELHHLPAQWATSFSCLRLLSIKNNAFSNIWELRLEEAESLEELHIDGKFTPLSVNSLTSLPKNATLHF